MGITLNQLSKAMHKAKEYIDNKQGLNGKSAYEIAKEAGFEGTKEEWLESLKGQDGETGSDGKSILSITKDDNNNLIVTFTDNTIKNIGQLSIDISADFLTEKGFGNLRFLNGKFQYYDETSDAWIDTAVGPENVYVMHMIPKEMTSISATYDANLGCNKLKWEEAKDTIVDGQALCIVDKVVIRRKLDSAPIDENDGDLVIEVPRSQFGQHKNTFYIDEAVTPVEGDTYYYKAFPQSTMGYYNYGTVNEAYTTWVAGVVFGFRIDQTESDPASMITYIADNENFSSAYIDYTTYTFNYGDWTIDNGAWFMDVKPCMLNYNGTVAYYLDPNDYTKKIDGTDSDIANVNFTGNAMVQIPKVYYKCVNISDNVAEYYFSNKKLDDDYHCWSHIDSNNNEIDYCYMPCYEGWSDGTKLRSISGQIPCGFGDMTKTITQALANNPTEKNIWCTSIFADRQLINLLLILIGKTTDSQSVFGNGYYNHPKGQNANINDLIKTGAMNTKGLFYGTNGSVDGIKVFGMEQYWGNRWEYITGWIIDNGLYKVKLTYGQSDGSTIDGYNTTGDGYIEVEGCILSSALPFNYINKMKFTEYGLIPISSNGSATTYYTDTVSIAFSRYICPLIGGDLNDEYCCGMFATSADFDVSIEWALISSSISCKPLALTN